MKGKTITISSWKGGTGKTTLNVAIAGVLAKRGGKVLIIDLDSNCAISQIYGRIMQDFSSMEFLSDTGGNFAGLYPASGNIDIMPGNIKNMLLNNIMDTQLKINLRRSGLAEKYEYILIDPPGYWGAHTRNAVFAADVLVIPGTCSRIDFEATKLYFNTLRQCYLEADTYVCVNEFNKRVNLPGIYEEYQAEFGAFLLPEPVPHIQSLKRLTDDVNYPLHPAVKKRLERFVDCIIDKEAGDA
jgi:cellulose biosynthesis protein BcsQ